MLVDKSLVAFYFSFEIMSKFLMVKYESATLVSDRTAPIGEIGFDSSS